MIETILVNGAYFNLSFKIYITFTRYDRRKSRSRSRSRDRRDRGRRERSRSRSRPSASRREASYERERDELYEKNKRRQERHLRSKINKERLLEIAKKNAAKILKSGGDFLGMDEERYFNFFCNLKIRIGPTKQILFIFFLIRAKLGYNLMLLLY